MTVGILAAMHDEIAGLLADMGGADGTRVQRIGMRDYYVGELERQPCVLVLARIGKVAAAATAVTLIRELGATEIIFTGLAGGISPEVKVGDVVIGDRLVHHDLDVRPLFPRHEVPLLGLAEFSSDASLATELHEAANAFMQKELHRSVSCETLSALGIAQPSLHRGLIASGDQFVSEAAKAELLRAMLPTALAVEMEGAAVAQICHEYGVPCAIVRTISDRADDSAHVDFVKFLSEVASRYSTGIVRSLLARRGG